MDLKHSKNMEYLMNYWREIIDSKLKPQGALYAEGGPMKADDLQSKLNRKYNLATPCKKMIYVASWLCLRCRPAKSLILLTNPTNTC